MTGGLALLAADTSAGFVLACVIGLASLAAGTLVARSHPRGDDAALVAGIALAIWIVVETVMLQTVHPLQIVYLAVAIAIIALAFRDRLSPSPV